MLHLRVKSDELASIPVIIQMLKSLFPLTLVLTMQLNIERSKNLLQLFLVGNTVAVVRTIDRNSFCVSIKCSFKALSNTLTKRVVDAAKFRSSKLFVEVSDAEKSTKQRFQMVRKLKIDILGFPQSNL